MRGAALACGICVLTGANAAVAQAPEEIWEEVEIAQGVLAFVTTEAVAPSSYANTIVFYGSEASVVVDTQDRPAAAERISHSLRDRGLPPVRWIVNTHWHADHTLGNSTLLQRWPSATLLAHPATRDSIRVGGDRHVAEQRERLLGRATRIEEAVAAGQVAEEAVPRWESVAAESRVAAEELVALRIPVPSGVVADTLRIDLGGRELLILHPGVAHTEGDLVVWDAGSGVLAAGDLLEEAPLWIEGADVRGWAQALERLAELRPREVLPSHGRVRGDARLLDAHLALLRRAAEVADGFASSAATRGAPGSEELNVESAFGELLDRLETYGVGREAVGIYAAQLVERLRGG